MRGSALADDLEASGGTWLRRCLRRDRVSAREWPLLGEVAAIDRDRHSGEVCGGRTREERNGRGDVLCLSDPSERNCGGHFRGFRLGGGKRGKPLIVERRAGHARGYCVDPNVVAGELDGRSFGERKHCPFRRTVNAHCRYADARKSRSDVDDRASGAVL